MKYLKCDRHGCDHVEEVENITKDLIGTPCPECGANLLTEKDYKAFRRMMIVLKPFKWLGLLKEIDPTEPVEEGRVDMSFHHHNGKTTIEEINR